MCGYPMSIIPNYAVNVNLTHSSICFKNRLSRPLHRWISTPARYDAFPAFFFLFLFTVLNISAGSCSTVTRTRSSRSSV